MKHTVPLIASFIFVTGCSVAPPAPQGFNRIALAVESPSRQALGAPVADAESPKAVPFAAIPPSMPTRTDSAGQLPALVSLPALPYLPSSRIPPAQTLPASTSLLPSKLVSMPVEQLQFRFAYAAAVPEQGAAAQIKQLMATLSPTDKVMIVGRTDGSGSQQLNKILAQRRADAVRALVLSNGVPGSKVFTSTCADCYSPSTDREVNRTANRSVQLEVVRQRTL